ncbi:MAG: peroxiredoxin [Rhodothermales bacterium]|nr:peroxiredoxin [Rhodothermales bacterium]MBO6779340.1 peroxiredoxin [Rhodothermales bacterium]
MSSTPEIGAPAPPFAGPTQDGHVSSDELRGKKVALYFYPRDNTPGCTKQACNLRDNFEALQDAGVVIVGVSDDPAAKHAKFAEKFDLPFPLIADTEHEVLNAYGARREKNMYGKKYMGTVRSTYLIDESGTLVDIIKKPKVGNHAAEIMERFGL